MVRLNTFYYNGLCCFIFICNLPFLVSQGNCLVYPEDSGERIACELSYRAVEYRQGSKESQLLFDQAIKLGPKYAWAYYEKSVPFFKRGLFAEGVKLINKAIELEPQHYLYYRAYWYFYNRSFDLCIKDLEELYTHYNPPYTSTPGGELEMRLLLGMAHAQTGNLTKGINWVLHLMNAYKDQPHLKGYYDHFCLGVLYFKNGQLTFALDEFEKQLTVDENFADTYYYLGLIKKKEGDHELADSYFQEALNKFKGSEDGYSINIFTAFNTYQEDIEEASLN